MRHIIPIGRPRWVYKSEVKCSFLESWFLESDLKWPNDLEGQDQWPLYSKPVWRISRRIFGTNLMILVQIHYKLLHGQAKFPRILSQNGQNYLECQGQWPLILNNSWEYPMMHTWHKFGDSSPNGQNYLEGRDEWLIFSIPTESVSGCMFIAKLVIIAQIGGQLSCGKSKVHGLTDRRTDRRTQATTISLRPERPKGNKNEICVPYLCINQLFMEPWHFN